MRIRTRIFRVVDVSNIDLIVESFILRFFRKRRCVAIKERVVCVRLRSSGTCLHDVAIQITSSEANLKPSQDHSKNIERGSK